MSKIKNGGLDQYGTQKCKALTGSAVKGLIKTRFYVVFPLCVTDWDRVAERVTEDHKAIGRGVTLSLSQEIFLTI